MHIGKGANFATSFIIFSNKIPCWSNNVQQNQKVNIQLSYFKDFW